jgi:hypothetical protein
MEGKIEKIERSENHEELRWLTIDGQLYSLWDSVNDEELAIGQLVEFEAEEIPGRNFFKISKIKPVKAKKKAEAKDSSDFSKTEIGLMISVAVKAAAQISSSVEELTEKAEAIYSYLKAKRLSEVEEAKE